MKDGRVSEQKDGQYVWKLDEEKKNIKTIKIYKNAGVRKIYRSRNHKSKHL